MSSPDHPFYKPEVQIPRFLFRGFNKYSGGGTTGLNQRKGVLPLAHLLGWDTKEQVDRQIKPEWLKARVRIHCCEKACHPTPFSSWSHDWRTALAFSLTTRIEADGEVRKEERLEARWSSHIAVLDTWALGDETLLRNKIFHVDQFDIPKFHLACEWLIWGPVSGPAYRCVPLAHIREATNCHLWPLHTNDNPKLRPYLVHTEIYESMVVAGCFQRRRDDSADVMLAVAAAELSRRFWGRPVAVAPDGDPEYIFDTEPLWPRRVLEEVLDYFALIRPVLSGRPLVHGSTAIEGFPRVSLMYDLLLGAEARWRNNDGETRWAGVDLSEWEEGLCGTCLKRGYYGADA